jgi:hypothetical protein
LGASHFLKWIESMVIPDKSETVVYRQNQLWQ